MNPDVKSKTNVRQAVPFFMVSDMEASLRFYTDGLGFKKTIQWTPHGRIEWCWLQLGGAALMLQEYRKDGHGAFSPSGKLGEGVSVCFICEDALAIYREIISRGVKASEPFVGNTMWVTELSDPDGYKLFFESETDVPEETRYSAWVNSAR